MNPVLISQSKAVFNSTPSPFPKPPRSIRVKTQVPGKSSLLDEAYNAYCRLQEVGEPLEAEAFCARYPAIQSSLTRLILAHRFLEENSYLLDEDQARRWPEPGESFNGFEILRELGQGAFARVYLAREPALGNRLVALKVSPRGSQEAATLGRLAHANVVPVFSVVEDTEHNLFALCMPYLGGATLANVLDHVHGNPGLLKTNALLLEAIRDPSLEDSGLPPKLRPRDSFADGVRDLAIQLTNALAFLHDRGICHRDLKPSNILMRPDGTPMLLDFNLSSDRQSPHNQLGGTLLYMAPEQLLATDPKGTHDSKTLDARADLFSLGVILYELLTGRHPFGPLPLEADASQLRAFLLEKQARGIAPLPDQEIASALVEVIQDCLAFQPEKRPASAQEIAHKLRGSLGWFPRLQKEGQRRPKLLGASLFLLLSILFAGTIPLTNPVPEHQHQLELGKAALIQRDLPSALQHFNASIQAHPSPEGFFRRGQVYVRLAKEDTKHYALALADFYQAEKLEKNWRNKAYQAFCLQRQGQTDAVKLLYEEVLETGIESAEIQNNLGVVLSDLGLLEKAKANLEEALDLNPKLQAAHYNLAKVYFNSQAQMAGAAKMAEKKALLAKAVAQIKAAKKLGPLTGAMLLDGAMICAKAGTFEPEMVPLALNFLEKAIDNGVDPKTFPPGDIRFKNLWNHPQYQALMRRSPPPNSPDIAPIRLVEPVGD